MEEESNEAVASSCPDHLTTTMSNTLAPISQRAQTNHTDRQTVQVIQQAMHRPAGVAQYLQQMYAAQQHHIMLQTLHQHQQTTSHTTHSTASIQQVSQSNSRKTASPPSSASGNAAPTAITLPSSAVTQLQSPSVSGSAGTIAQQAVLLGNGSTPCSQAQMYLRTQMLILAPAASVAADLPALSSNSSQPSSTQVTSLALRTHLPGALSSAQGVQLKASEGQTLVTPFPRMSICPLKSTQLSQTLAETSRTFSPALMRHQLHCPSTQKGVPPQFILQSSIAQRQVQPIALRVTAQDHPPLSLLTGTTPTPAAVLSQHCKEDRAGVEVVRGEEQKSPDRSRTPTPTALAHTEEPQNSCRDTTQPEPCTGPLDSSCLQPSRNVILSAEDAAATSPPPSLRPAVRSSSSSLPSASVRPHILTHLIEGFVITEGLEPFPVGRSPLGKQQQARLPEDRELQENGEPEHHNFLPDTEQPENSSESDMDNTPAEDERLEVNSLALLQCEFCGKRGYTRTLLRSKRFCSTTCVRSFNLNSTKRLAVLRAHRVTRWPNRPMGRRGRPPSRMNRTHREHFFRQLQGSYGTDYAQQASISQRAGEDGCEDEDSPGPMTTRLRLQAEKEREREREGRQREDCSSSTGLLDCSPALWSVEQVCSYITSLPGCQDMVAEFRSQEIDGQALLLLTEEHLMNAMNIKLGPALKICAHINSLKQP